MLANPSLQLRSLIGVDLRDCVRPLHYPPEMKTWKQYRLLTFFRENPTGENGVRASTRHGGHTHACIPVTYLFVCAMGCRKNTESTTRSG